MTRRPRPPREIKRSTDAVDAAVSSGVRVRRRDARQAELCTTAFIPPCKPTLRPKAPWGMRWQFEIKHEGYRAQCHVAGDNVRIFTKSGFDWAARMPAIGAALRALPVADAVIDGEAVMEGSDGVTDFFALHAALAAKSAPRAFLYAFDLLHLDGEDLRALPLDERRLLLEDLLTDAPPALRFSEHVLSDGPTVFEAARSLSLEGVVAKVRDAPYRSGRTDTWLKIKSTKVGTFVVTGYDPDGSYGVRSLMIAEGDGRKLVPAGSVGSGLTAATSRDLRRRLDADETISASRWNIAAERRAAARGARGHPGALIPLFLVTFTSL